MADENTAKMPSYRSIIYDIICLCFLTFFSISRASVPSSQTFTYINEGEFGPYIVEYDADYRTLPPFRNPFQLCFYNTTPNAFTLALRMGTARSESRMRWVWEANRGKPVKENATISFLTNGNLVLSESDGRVVWQTNTAGKGVVGFELLPNGNMVLHDSKGNFIWQSFDSPTDTLLVGQSLRLGGVNKLVSRASAVNNVDGVYSLVLEPKRLALYYNSTNSPRPMLYWSSENTWTTLYDGGSFTNVTLASEPENDDNLIYYLQYNYHQTNPSRNAQSSSIFTRYNNTLSYMRLAIDGNIRYFTYSFVVQLIAWDNFYNLFDTNTREGGCQLPSRCGKFGLCEDNQCVACPTPDGLKGWSRDCEAKKVTSCKASDFHYYKIEGVDHFIVKFTRGDGATKQSDCERKCTGDCKCMGYFYHTQGSRCWIAYELGTMTRVANSTHLAYIKTPNK